MNRRTVAGVIAASGLALIAVSSLWLREVRTISREDPFGVAERLRLTPDQPVPGRSRQELRWKDAAIDQQKALESAARAMVLH